MNFYRTDPTLMLLYALLRDGTQASAETHCGMRNTLRAIRNLPEVER